LTPNGNYHFRINAEVDEFLFRTMPLENSSPIRFVVGGDMYHDTLEEMNITSDKAAKTDPAFAVIGGDIAYVHGKGAPRFYRWIEWIQSWHTHMVAPGKRMIPVVVAIGNHDVQGQFDQTPTQAAAFAALYPMPGKKIFNVLDFGSYLSLFLLDSGHANSIGGAQTDWLKTALDARKGVRNKFAIYHVPSYPCIRSLRNERSAQIRQHWLPLFESKGVRVAFEHHDHAYKRTFPLLQNKVDPKGVIFIGDGGWGAGKARQRTKGNLPFYLNKFIPARHFILVTVQDRQQLFQCIKDDGSVIDELRISVDDKQS
jgi:acid phosphatase type 7